MSIFKLNNVFWIAILIFRFENNNLEFKYQFLDSMNNFQTRIINYENPK
jgi:hypothetical protein